MNWTDFISLNRSRFFYAGRNHGKYECGNARSRYLDRSDPEKCSFDTGNNKVITLSGLNGELKRVTFFKPSYFADNIPGVWVHKGHILAGPFSFALAMDGRVLHLPEFEGAIRTDLVECVLPLTYYQLDGLDAHVTAYAPVSEDGRVRPRCAFYLLSLCNRSDGALKGEVILPQAGHFSKIMEKDDLAQLDIRSGEDFSHRQRIAFELRPGEQRLFPVLLTVYGEAVSPQIRRGPMYWLEQTLGYYRRLAGKLQFEDDPFLSEFMKRTLCQCQQCIGMDGDETLAGSSWGTNPTTDQIWMKDMYYSMLPLAQCDPELFFKGVKWFAKWGVRPEGMLFAGGVNHSLSNSLSAVLMAGEYFACTGDIESFRRDGALVERLTEILDDMIMSRTQRDVWLFPSVWISDGLALGDFHTGTNITAWAALNGMAAILEALPDAQKSAQYRAVAARVREAITTLCVTDGPYGPQLLEGVGEGSQALKEQMKADSLEAFRAKNEGFGIQFYEFYNRAQERPYLVHDGEETDTTLAAFYGLMEFDDAVLRNYFRFAMSEHNRFYCPVSRGILWEDCTDSTFPGYVTGMANAVDAQSYSRYFEPIRELADLDGSIWWWPYPRNAGEQAAMRRDPGKCGWASGALLALMQRNIMGIYYDGAKRELSFCPLDALGNFCWTDAPLGEARFDLAYEGDSIWVTNRNRYTVTLKAGLFADGLQVNQKSCASQKRTYFGRTACITRVNLLPGERTRVCACTAR